MISMIIPSYNRVRELQRCMKSVLTQYYDGLEVIVIDDFSIDSTREYLATLAVNHPYIKVYLNDQNHGVNYARNRGIEIATKPFILFLDSDDKLADGCLVKVKSILEANPTVKHFLFGIADREEEFKILTTNTYIKYEDWLRGKVYGDFTHVVSSGILKKYMFFEQFRMFEFLNWLRIKKESSPQLLVPLVTTICERNRSDSLTTSSKLLSLPAIRLKFESEQMYYSLYHEDLKRYSPKALNLRLIYTILLGIASNRRRESNSLVKYAFSWHIRTLGNVIMLLPSSLIKFGIIYYSNFKKRGG